MTKMIRRAGPTRWPKPFPDLGTMHDTDLVGKSPIYVVCEWIGNSAAVAAKHHLQVIDAHCEQAAQNAPQQAHAESSLGSQTATTAQKKAPVLLGSALRSETPQFGGVGDTGLEPVTPAM